MLDTDTKRRIDTARDILVGKVPDPKSQVEQITIALIYKFMDDMDAEAEEMGGPRKFFAGDFSRYGWAKLMRVGLGGQETLNLYAEAIGKMPENPGIPLLFRDIFKNAYLPYRDPETLRAFLKVVDEFTYDHSERLGDAFEYLLSVLGSQGDAGQFRTPRDIIDFMVAIVDPKKTETVLDPACGTAGFLISSYKHILRVNTDGLGHSTLTPDEKGQLAANFKGYDISPDMVRLSLVNLYLHGFTDPHIVEYDTLTSDERWNEHADVILANPPFMSPKGGIKPHNRFSVQSKRSEVLFVDYMAEHLTPQGRAGIIVPEGIIFQSGTAYRQLREMLVNDFLTGVISLPSGVFMPYTGVKTSILVLDRQLAKRTPNILFSEVRHIGVSLGVKRTRSQHNDLPSVLRDYRAFLDGGELSRCSWVGAREKILAGDCSLTGAHYRPAASNGDTRLVRLADICAISKGTSSSTTTPPGPYPLILTAAEPKTSLDYELEGPAVCVPLISSLGHGKAALHRIHYVSGKFALANLLAALKPHDETQLDAKFLYHALDQKRADLAGLMRGAANVSMKPEDLAQFEIPVPPLIVQKEIVAEIESFQRVIDGARAVLDNYSPHIPIHPEWPMVPVGQVCEAIVTGPFGSALHQSDYVENGIPVINPQNIVEGVISRDGAKQVSRETRERLAEFTVRANDVIIGRRGEMGRCAVVTPEMDGWLCGTGCFVMRLSDQYDPQFAFLQVASRRVKAYLEDQAVGVTMMNLNQGILAAVPVPLPPLAEQRAIVAEVDAERALVNANRELILRFEKKVRATLVRVWGSDDGTPAEA